MNARLQLQVDNLISLARLKITDRKLLSKKGKITDLSKQSL
jgi:hypothetical protein